MTIPVKFRKSRENTITSYDFTDIANGLGYENYYATQSFDTASGQLLIPTTEKSADPQVRSSGAGSEYNFDTSTFNLPRTVSGTAYLSFETNIAAGTMRTDIILYKVDAANAETAISGTVTRTGTTTNAWHFYDIPLTETIIKKGEKLRLSITLTSSTGTDGIMGTDPEGSTDGTLLNTRNKLSIPFKISI